MSKNKLERIAGIEEQIRQLENQRKQLLQQHKEQERKERTHRICKRGGLLESLVPDAIALTDEQFKIFLEKTVKTEFARKILNDMKSQDSEPAAPKSAGAEQNGGTGVQLTHGCAGSSLSPK